MSLASQRPLSIAAVSAVAITVVLLLGCSTEEGATSQDTPEVVGTSEDEVIQPATVTATQTTCNPIDTALQVEDFEPPILVSRYEDDVSGAGDVEAELVEIGVGTDVFALTAGKTPDTDTFTITSHSYIFEAPASLVDSLPVLADTGESSPALNSVQVGDEALLYPSAPNPGLGYLEAIYAFRSGRVVTILKLEYDTPSGFAFDPGTYLDPNSLSDFATKIYVRIGTCDEFAATPIGGSAE